MELRELRAFVAAANELHFARAAASLYMNASTMSELIRKLELELGTPLFTRTTRKITLTDAGAELLGRAEVILALTAQAVEAVGAVGRGGAGAVRLGCTPPAAPVIAPHLRQQFRATHPELSVEIQRMWLPALGAALETGAIDVALTCGDLVDTRPGVSTVELGSEQLLVALRPEDPLAEQDAVTLAELGTRTLGLHAADLFPAWFVVQRDILAAAHIAPPRTELNDIDLTARRWVDQPGVDWVMLTASLASGHADSVIRPVPGVTVPFTLSWSAHAAARPAVLAFLETSRSAPLPAGWLTPA